MRKKILFSIFLFIMTIFMIPNVYAFDSSTYQNHTLSNTYEVVQLKSNGEIINRGGFNYYENARDEMKRLGDTDLVVMTNVYGGNKIIDANAALLDLTVNPEDLTYYYTNSDLKGASYTYMLNRTSYGGVDGAHLGSSYSNYANCFTAKVLISNFEGWLPMDAYEIVPLSWVKSSSNYLVSDTDIRHNLVSKIQEAGSDNGGRNIGPKPEMLGTGGYFSYDGHYFYTHLETLIRDAKNGTRENAVNKNNPYYNYYMYLSNHTKTSYSSINIDEYIRNNLGYHGNVYGYTASNGTSRLYGTGTFFYYAQQRYGVNAILALSLSRNETGNGRSYLAINKNNGFGLNAVDSNPINGASWYATFPYSILGYAQKWITYGYAHPRDWRYFGPQYGDKGIGMNVKYASDTYWGEKMAANYYSLDKALGLQDYNYYQLGVTNGSINAYLSPNTSSKVVYTYTEKEDAVVIVGEENGWYKLVSDLNIDNNGNEITWGDYNWNSVVYVKTSDVTKINQGKNGYIHPNEAFEYEDSNYQYDLYIENTELKPKVAITTKNTTYYYDSSLSSSTNVTALKDRYVMVYATAYKNNMPVSYLITKEYYHDQKEWVSADSIKFVSMNYGQMSISVDGNPYSWVNYNTEDASYSVISGLYDYTYVPIIETLNVDGTKWYKVPVNLTGNDNVYGYTLAHYSDSVFIKEYSYSTGNNKPVINAKDKTLIEGDTFNPKEGVTASDAEDGDLTSKIEVIENNVNTTTPGEYKVTYKVVDNSSNQSQLSIKVTVKENKAPVINASDKNIYVGDTFNPKEGVTSTDPEDGNITQNIKVTTNNVNTNTIGTYKVIYEVSDSRGKKTTKEIKVNVLEKIELDLDDIDIDELLEQLDEGEFYLHELTWDKEKKQFTISGYCIILNHNNTSKEYALVFVNKDTEEAYVSEIEEWKNNTPYDLGSENGNSYSNSWFKGTIDFSSIPNGDYEIYMLGVQEDAYTIQLVNNFLNKKVDRRGEDAHHGYNFKEQQKIKKKELELSVRNKLYTTNTAPTDRNMVNGYDEIKWNNNKLSILGYSYDYQGVYDKKENVTRKMILENNSTYEQTVFDLGSTKGPFDLITLDGKDKTYAWYENELDLASLPKGEYTLYVYTKTGNAENYDVIPDMFKSLNLSTTINNKKYTIYCNRSRNNRIELKVE